MLTHEIPPGFRDGIHSLIYFYRQPLFGKSRVYQVTQLRTDGIHCREYACTGPVVLKIVRVTGVAIISGILYVSFPTPTIYWYDGLLFEDHIFLLRQNF